MRAKKQKARNDCLFIVRAFWLHEALREVLGRGVSDFR